MRRAGGWLTISLHFVAIALGTALGAAAAVVGIVVLLDLMLGAPACEPDEAVGCGASIGLVALAFGLPLGALAGGWAACRLAWLAAPNNPQPRR